MTTAPERINVAVVGLGFIASSQYLPCLTRRNDVRIAALVDPDRAKLESTMLRYGIQAGYTDVSELKSEEIDAAIVLTPKHLNAEVTGKLLVRGIHVLCEKPIAMEHGSALRNVKLAEKNKRVYMIAMNRRYTDVYELARKEMEGRKIEICIGKKIRDSAYVTERPLMDYGIHVLDAMNWLCGEEISDVTATARWSDPYMENSVIAHIEYTSGIRGVFIMSNQAGMWSEQLTLIGEDITVEIDAPHSLNVIKDGKKTHIRCNGQGFQSSYEFFGFGKQLDYFLGAVRSKPNGSTQSELVHSALNSERLVQKIYASCGLPDLYSTGVDTKSVVSGE